MVRLGYLHLWFACFLPGFCLLAVDDGTELAAERDSSFPFAVVRGPAFSYLAVRPALDGAGVEFGACAYGGDGEPAATASVEQIRAEAGLDLTEAADLVVGTSSGAAVAAWVRSGIPPAELLASVLSEPVQPVRQNRERPPSLPMATVFERMRAIGAAATSAADLRRAMGAFGLESDSIVGPGAGRRRALVAARLPRHEWPDKATAAAPAVDPLDAQAMNGVLANAARLAKPSVFDTEVAAARTALTSTASKPYEAALVTLGQLAGAQPSDADHGASAAPDATWIFGTIMWVAWEAKSKANPDGELGADDVREAGGHLRFIAKQRNQAAPGDSVVLLMAPQNRIHPSAHAVAEDHVLPRAPGQGHRRVRPAGPRLAHRPRPRPHHPVHPRPDRDLRRQARAALAVASPAAHPSADSTGRQRRVTPAVPSVPLMGEIPSG